MHKSHLLFWVQITMVFQLVHAAASEKTQPDIPWVEIRKTVQANQFQKVIDLLNPIVVQQLPPKDKDRVQFLRGVSNFYLSHNAEAELFLKSVPEAFILNDYVYYYLSQVYDAQKNTDLSQSFLEKSLKAEPHAKLTQEILLSTSDSFFKKKNYQQAKNALLKLQKRIRHEEKEPHYYFQLAHIEKALGQKKLFCDRIRKLFTHFPQFPEIQDWGPDLPSNLFFGEPTQCAVGLEDLKKRIQRWQSEGLPNRARVEIQSLKNKIPKVDPFEIDQLEAQYLMQEQEPEKAISLLKKYFEGKKNDPHFLFLMAGNLAKAGEYQAAVGLYYRLYQRTPQTKQGRKALFQAAFLSYQFKDYDGAYKKFLELVKKFPNATMARDAEWQISWISYLREDYESSLKSFLKSKSAPQERSKYWAAMSYLKLGQIPKARDLFLQLSQNKLRTYYTVAAAQRLNALKSSRPNSFFKQESMNSLFLTESLFPIDDQIPTVVTLATLPSWPQKSSDPAENEDENIADATLATGEESADPEDVDPEEADNSTVAEKGSIIEEFSDPKLVKRFEKAKEAALLGFQDWAKWELYEIEKKTRNKDYLKTLMAEYEKIGVFQRSAGISQNFFSSQRANFGIDGNRSLWESAYPAAYKDEVEKTSRRFDVPQSLIWAIMRAESLFRKEARSPVGALGLMQVMPQTGIRMAYLLGEKDFQASDLLRPSSALLIGTAYLQRLSKKFQGDLVFISAGYNAGPHRVISWVSQFGNLDLDEFVEHIPFLETRNYVKKVLSNAAIYNELYFPGRDGLSSLGVNLAAPVRVKFFSPDPGKETWEEI